MRKERIRNKGKERRVRVGGERGRCLARPKQASDIGPDPPARSSSLPAIPALGAALMCVGTSDGRRERRPRSSDGRAWTGTLLAVATPGVPPPPSPCPSRGLTPSPSFIPAPLPLPPSRVHSPRLSHSTWLCHAPSLSFLTTHEWGGGGGGGRGQSRERIGQAG